jgi:hypothetical protein
MDYVLLYPRKENYVYMWINLYENKVPTKTMGPYVVRKFTSSREIYQDIPLYSYFSRV